MANFVGIKHDNINVVSDQYFESDDFKVIELPEELKNIPPADLILNYKYSDNKIISKKGAKSAKNIKLALVGNWRMKCGISTYNQNLWAEVVKHVGDFKLFIEHNESPTDDIYLIGEQKLSQDKVTSCWKRGESLLQLVQEIKNYNPDIIWINHEFGLFPNARHWLSMLSLLNNYRIIVTMHSIFHHKDKTIVEAAMPEIVTHLQGGYDVLKNEKKISGKVYVIPHGCFPLSKERLWNYYKSDHTIIQAGFLFKYKGWEDSLNTVALLKNKYPDIFFTGLCSESDYNKIEHQMYFDELQRLISKLGIEENVSLIRGFQSDEVWDSFFKTNKVALFPYKSEKIHEVFGSSGAAREAMAKGLPVISSRGNHFADLPTIKADSVEEMAKEIDHLFSNNKNIEKQLKIQKEFIEAHSWDKIALQYIKIFES